MFGINVKNECGNGGILGVNVLIGAMLGVNVKNEYMGNEYGNVNVRNVRKLMLGMLESFDRWKYMNVWNEF